MHVCNAMCVMCNVMWILLEECKSTDLHNVEGTELDPPALFWVVDLGSFDDYCVSREIDTPRQGRRGHENLDVTVSKQILHQCTIHSVNRSILIYILFNAVSSLLVPEIYHV